MTSARSDCAHSSRWVRSPPEANMTAMAAVDNSSGARGADLMPPDWARFPVVRTANSRPAGWPVAG